MCEKWRDGVMCEVKCSCVCGGRDGLVCEVKDGVW